MKIKQKKTNAIKLFVDGAITLAVLALLSIPLTGLALHEWLGIAIIGALVVHLLLNWAWIIATTRRFFGALPSQVRINYILNAALFIAMTTVIASGLMISVVALPFLGFGVHRNTFLSILHLVSADALLVIVGLHLGMNWKWVSSMIGRQIIAPSRERSGRRAITRLASIPRARKA